MRFFLISFLRVDILRGRSGSPGVGRRVSELQVAMVRASKPLGRNHPVGLCSFVLSGAALEGASIGLDCERCSARWALGVGVGWLRGSRTELALDVGWRWAMRAALALHVGSCWRMVGWRWVGLASRQVV